MSSPSIPFHLAEKIIINRPLSPRLIKIPLKFLLRPLLMQLLTPLGGRFPSVILLILQSDALSTHSESEPLNTFALNISANF